MMHLTDKSMDISIELNGITCIIGPTNSGKTLFLKKLINKIDNKSIYIDNKCIKEYDDDYLRRNIVVVLDDNYYKTKTVYDELYINLKILNYKSDEIDNKIKDILNYFKIKDLLNTKLENLKYEDKILIKILSYLIINPSIIGIDNMLIYLNKDKKNKLYKYIKDNNICLLNVVTDSSYILESDYCLIMNNFKAIMYNDSINVLKGNNILPYMGINLPFTIDLSNNLIAYDIINSVEFDIDKLVNKIWK